MATKKQDDKKRKVKVNQAFTMVTAHPMFRSMSSAVYLVTESGQGRKYPNALPFSFDQNGMLFVRLEFDWSTEEWAYCIAMAMLNLGLGLVQTETKWHDVYAHTANHLEAHRFLENMKHIKVPERFAIADGLPSKPAKEMEMWLRNQKTPQECQAFLPYEGLSFFAHSEHLPYVFFKKPDFQKKFGEGVRNSIQVALDVAAGRRASLLEDPHVKKETTLGQEARFWLLANYPLLSGIAACFKIEESIDACRQRDVKVGMIDMVEKVVYLNPLAGLTKEEWIWVLAHEYLHAGLNHSARIDGRDPQLWNAACDFAINMWLEELKIGTRPSIGVLFDDQFKGWSAERIYEFLTKNIRFLRKWETLAGPEKCDFIGKTDGTITDAEEFCRSALVQGSFKHTSNSRGFLPAELAEAIRALEQPVIPWDVQLGRWFSLNVPFPEKRRSYMRQSRRQSASPETPLARQITMEEYKSNAHTFGVILDTSGSMSRVLLAKALGTIAQYALAHEVPAVRLVFCDARPYDAGYVRAEDLMYETIQVQGRGGTVLEPAVTYFDKLEDFPEDAPLLILTDGEIDTFQVKRKHAFVLPKGKRLPFAAESIFYVS